MGCRLEVEWRKVQGNQSRIIICLRIRIDHRNSRLRHKSSSCDRIWVSGFFAWLYANENKARLTP